MLISVDLNTHKSSQFLPSKDCISVNNAVEDNNSCDLKKDTWCESHETRCQCFLTNLRGRPTPTSFYHSRTLLSKSGVIPIWAGRSDKEEGNTHAHTNKLASAWTNSSLMFHVALFSFCARILNKNTCLHAIMFLSFASPVSPVLITETSPLHANRQHSTTVLLLLVCLFLPSGIKKLLKHLMCLEIYRSSFISNITICSYLSKHERTWSILPLFKVCVEHNNWNYPYWEQICTNQRYKNKTRFIRVHA